MINDQRIAHFKQAITDTLDAEDLNVFRMVLEQYRQEHNTTMLDIASALAKIVRGDEPLLLPADVERRRERPRNGTQSPRNRRNQRSVRIAVTEILRPRKPSLHHPKAWSDFALPLGMFTVSNRAIW